MAGWIKMPHGMDVGFSPGDFLLDGDPAPPPQKGCRALPKFSTHVYCGQAAGWTKMPLAMEVGRPRPRRLCVRRLDVDPARPRRKGA